MGVIREDMGLQRDGGDRERANPVPVRHDVAGALGSPVPGAAPRSALARRFAAVRAETVARAAPLSAEDQCIQSMPEASPTKWHLAHTSWFFETFVLAGLPGEAAPRADFAFLFNSYYEGVGPRVSRGRRGMLSRPSLAEVHAYRAAIDDRMLARLEDGDLPAGRLALVELGLAHEEQHQELLLTDILHALHENPLRPAYDVGWRARGGAAAAGDWVQHDEQIAWIGAGAEGFAFDCERPRHRRLVPAFRIARRLVTAGEYLAFIDAGGYDQPTLWLADGWEARASEGWQAPLYWERADTGWVVHDLGGVRPVDASEPVRHVSYFEADAYARFAGARLPSEEEWEIAAMASPPPAALSGAAWQWTRSAYAPYPGFRPEAGCVGEYNGKFMSGQMVLRGSSDLTPAGHARPSYRNFFHPRARWQRSGIRLALDA